MQTFILQRKPPSVLRGLIYPRDLRHTVTFKPSIHNVKIGVCVRMLAARIRKEDQVHGDTVLLQPYK